MRDAKQKCLFDVWAGTNYLGSATLTGTQRVELVLFESRDRAPTNITIYFPHKEEVRVLAVGVDERARLGAAPVFALPRPIVCYGSSVMQGSGAAHPSRTYPAALARRLNLDFVNFGFGGAGKAEPEVVRLINELDASCWLFDLGKSYGNQSAEPFERMLDAVRAAHPKVPIFCITPIYSVRENTDAAYRERSVNLRVMMRAAAEARQRTGDKSMFVIEGLDLFGDRDKDAFHDPTHPNDEGNERIAERLQLMVQKVNFGR
jgi:lysophospholipase L1-like esterase